MRPSGGNDDPGRFAWDSLKVFLHEADPENNPIPSAVSLGRMLGIAGILISVEEVHRPGVIAELGIDE
jgi:hypothetical protein